MNRQLRGVSTVIVLMFVALFVSTTSIQFFSAEQLRADPRNSRTILASYSTKRGASSPRARSPNTRGAASRFSAAIASPCSAVR